MTMRLAAAVGEGAGNARGDVAVVQRLLVGAGLDPGPVDGRYGPRTRAALADWGAARIAPATPAFAALIEAGDWSGDPAGWDQAKRLRSLEPAFATTVAALIAALEADGHQPVIATAWRSVAQQAELVRQKRSTVRFSFHNAQTPAGRPAALAADLIDRRFAWRTAVSMPFFTALGAAARARGLVWGGDWAGFPDLAHVQARANAELAAVRRASGLA